MAEYFEVKATLDTIAQRIQSNVEAVGTARKFVNNVVGDLTAMQSDYAALVSEIDAAAAADPTDRAWELAKSEKDKLVTEFLAHKATAEALQSAMENA